MTGSAAEREIRRAVVSRLRELVEDARIVHELNVAGQGSNRIDVAAITKHAIIAVEIKSVKDTLARLDEQIPAFRACCHHVVVAAHAKHFKPYREEWWAEGRVDNVLDHPLFSKQRFWGYDEKVWRYPVDGERWALPERIGFYAQTGNLAQPRARDMLNMLWADELRWECGRHGIATGRRAAMGGMIADMVWKMTGREITEAVCRQLRSRHFAEADAPIAEEAAA